MVCAALRLIWSGEGGAFFSRRFSVYANCILICKVSKHFPLVLVYCSKHSNKNHTFGDIFCYGTI